MSGTPLPNRPAEILNVIDVLKPGMFSWKDKVRYCAAHQTRWGWDFSGAAHLDELQERLRETVMVRRLKKDVLTELPAKRRQVVEIPADECKSYIAAETASLEHHEALIEELKTKAEFAQAMERTEDYDAAVAQLRDASQAVFTEMSMLRHETALAKAPAVIEHVNGLLEDGGVSKVIVFAHHLDVIALLMTGLTAHRPVRLTGEDSQQDRQASVDTFQNDAACRVFVGGIMAAGVGITLTAASTVVFGELDWVPGNMSQAEDRAHRIGQTNSVLVQHIVLDGSMDARLAKTLVSKQDVIDRAMDRETVKTIITEPVEVEAKKKRELPSVTDDQIPVIHEALQFLARRCDGAHAIDGAGFNKFDAHFGKELAHCTALTAKQAAFGLRMVRKYRGQLPDGIRMAVCGQ